MKTSISGYRKSSKSLIVNDILDELREENQRLFNELLFSNKLLTKLNTILTTICGKCQTLLTADVRQQVMTITDCKPIINVGITAANSGSKCSKKSKKKAVEDIKKSPKSGSKLTKNIKIEVVDEEEEKTVKQIIAEKFNTKPVYKRQHVCDYPDCNQRFLTLTSLKVHKTRIHVNNGQKRSASHKRFICDWPGCLKEVSSKKYWYTHRKLHLGLKTHVCDQPDCNFRCSSGDLLKQHKRNRHSDERPHRCDHQDCEKTYKTLSALQSHYTTHFAHQYVCPDPTCDRKFSTETKLNRHFASHKAEPTLKCTIDGCDQLFFNDNELHRHRVVVHNRKYIKNPRKDYPCDWPGCDYMSDKHSLINHKRLHTNERPFGCDWPDCGKRFRMAKELKNHMNVHNNHKPYACYWPGCQYRCANSGNRAKHMKQVHKVSGIKGFAEKFGSIPTVDADNDNHIPDNKITVDNQLIN